MSDIATYEDKAPEAEKAPELDPEIWDENGMARPGKNVFTPAYAPTTTFHPLELPAHPIARANFPQDLINEGEWTQSPASDVPPDHRQRVGEAALQQHEQWLKDQQAEYEDVIARSRANASVPEHTEDHPAE